MLFLTHLGYVPGVTHFPSFSAPKCRKVLSENSGHGVRISKCNSPLQKILWDRCRYHWKIRVSWLRFWNHDVNWKPAKQTVGENTAVPLKIITLISTLIWLFFISGLLHEGQAFLFYSASHLLAIKREKGGSTLIEIRVKVDLCTSLLCSQYF